MANNLKSAGFKDLDLEKFTKGMSDGIHNFQPEMSLDEAHSVLSSHYAKMQAEADKFNKEAGQKFLENNLKSNPNVKVTSSGLQYEIIVEGTGAKPSVSDTVRCHYEGRLIDGNIFDSSYRRGEPIDFPVNGVIPGWVEALQLMPVGSKWKLYIPSDLAYGEHGAGEAIAPNMTLIFDVELLDIVKKIKS